MPSLNNSNEVLLGKIRSAVREYEIFDSELGKIKNLEDVISIDYVQDLENGDDLYDVYGESIVEDDMSYCSVLLKVVVSSKNGSVVSVQTGLVTTDDMMEALLEEE